ncbi:type I-E CRISPR-associated protein Cas6/Cse3/CasE [Lactobacillus sp. CBA3605]|uniref:type I-E CRISPR-associated protein Cas6/Cse3/CasE n=1 Tax=Lactobacillus sp. CBA3605 TaxID=2099788 RepID=UPI000CFC5365|nr:type I-E CRISPR-associated protein Cas6/Cse3/CasE [Lactobacillus sp. CBA3605]AVK61554.1 type I-E CRISPR-associated protein Cas6/Cse3/CasE [Lactobacillus sp. CBA3605]
MYLSRVEIDYNNRYKIKDLTHLGAFHNWVEQSFPAELVAEQRNRHLWRLDELAGRKYLLVLSADKPDLDLLVKYGVPGTAITKSYDQFLDKLQVGQLMRFRLTANPTHTISQPGKAQGRVVPHITIDQQRKWLMDRAEKSGFQLSTPVAADVSDLQESLTFDIVSREWPVLHRKAGRGVRLSRVTFEGVLRITDVADFKQTLIKGLGREKAFGMGLMTVIPED